MDEAKKDSALSIYRDGVFERDDWQVVDDETDLAGFDRVFVTQKRAVALFAEKADLPAALGITVEPDDDVAELVPYLDKIASISVCFPVFGDGRGFSSIRLLRERYGFSGEVRATGNYILDQMPFLVRCGVDTFVVSSDKVRAGLQRGEWPEVTHYYQPTGVDAAAIPASRPWLRQKSGQGLS